MTAAGLSDLGWNDTGEEEARNLEARGSTSCLGLLVPWSSSTMELLILSFQVWRLRES